MLKENEELKSKIKTKEGELFQLKSTSEKDNEDIAKELDTIETERRVTVDSKRNAEQEIQRLQEIIDNHGKVIRDCDQDISWIDQEKKAKESVIERNLANFKAAEDILTEEIENLRASLDSRIKTVDSLMREGVTEPVVSTEKQKLISFLTKSMEEKE